MHIGKYVSIGKQPIGLKGRHQDKLRFSHKNDGDGLQADTIYADGYTYNW